MAAASAVPGTALFGQSLGGVGGSSPGGQSGTSTTKGVLVAAGTDREGKLHTVGVSATTYKVLSAETAGAMFVMEQANAKKGGPTRHLHYSQDELFYVMEGEYILEIGSDRFRLKEGDCALGPRNVPHAWAFVGETKGRMLLTYSPAGRMEEFFNNREKLGLAKGKYTTAGDGDLLKRYGMEYVGPPIDLNSVTG
jgi:mannose-6-phosphate isomerase-like protein (cupin superfamily)